MPCCIALIALSAPRIAILLVVLFSDYIGRAYDGVLVPLLGFLFMPLTTLAYAYAMNTRGGLEGFPLVVFVLAVLGDLGLLGSNARRRPRKTED